MEEQFLPEDYVVPDKSNGYMKFEPGENQFRIVTKPIIGWEYWTEDEKGKHPIRVRQFQDVSDDFRDKAKHFWAMVVWSYKAKQLQILEITQKGIQKAIESLAKKPSWGSPLNYDLVIDRSGEGMDTEYTVAPEPKSDLPVQAKAALKAVSIELSALYEGKDPFAANQPAEGTEDVEIDEVDLFDREEAA